MEITLEEKKEIIEALKKRLEIFKSKDAKAIKELMLKTKMASAEDMAKPSDEEMAFVGDLAAGIIEGLLSEKVNLLDSDSVEWLLEENKLKVIYKHKEKTEHGNTSDEITATLVKVDGEWM